MVSCGSDDDEEVADVNSYIVGEWHSYKATIYYEGQQVTKEVTKTGEFSSAYFEMLFKIDGTMDFYSWQNNSSGINNWVKSQARYTINGDMVSILDSDGSTYDFIFDSKSKNLCLQLMYSYYGETAKVNLYFKK